MLQHYHDKEEIETKNYSSSIKHSNVIFKKFMLVKVLWDKVIVEQYYKEILPKNNS